MPTSLRGGHALQPTSTATSIRGDGNGGFTVTDGPFVETKEALGGYYLIEAADLDEAIAIGQAGARELRRSRSASDSHLRLSCS